MLQSLCQGIASLICLFVIPYFIGNGINRLLNIEKTFSKNYFAGMLTIWALFQIVSVPLVLAKAPFDTVVVGITILLCVLFLYGLVKGGYPRIRVSAQRNIERFSLGLMFLGMISLIVCTVFTQHTDWDDSRFVVNAVDMVRTNRMFLTDPIHGNATVTWIGELKKDVTAPWAVFIAYMAKMTGIYPTVMAHTVLPVVLLLVAFCVFWLLSEVFFSGDVFHRSIFVYLVILLHVFGHFSVYSSETFLLTRLWQGKAVVAGIGIPAMFLILMWLFDKKKTGRYQWLIWMSNLSICLMSGMGTIIGAMILGCTGLVYGIVKREKKIMLTLWFACLPNMVYFLLHSFI